MRGWLWVIFGLVLLTLLVIGLVLYFWAQTLATPLTLPAPQMYLEGGFGARCRPEAEAASLAPEDWLPSKCADGLTCVKIHPEDTWGFCYKAIGTLPCASLSECEPSALYCSRVCSLTRENGLGQYCSNDLQCAEGLVCDPSDITCKYPEGHPCLTDGQCFGTVCRPSPGGPLYCVPRGQDGAACQSDFECLPGRTCSDGFCQPVGRTTGHIGAVCRLHLLENPGCQGDLICAGDWSQATRDGHCAEMIPAWGRYACSAYQACPPPTLCYQGYCVLPRTASAYRTNACDAETTGYCSAGYTCLGGMCQPSSGFPASTGNLGLLTWTGQAWEPLATNLTGGTLSATESLVFVGPMILRQGQRYTLEFETSEPVTIRTFKALPGGRDGLIWYAFDDGRYGLLSLSLETFNDLVSRPEVSLSGTTFTVHLEIPEPEVDDLEIDLETITGIEADLRLGTEAARVIFSTASGVYLTQGDFRRYSGQDVGDPLTVTFLSEWREAIPYLYEKIPTNGPGILGLTLTEPKAVVEGQTLAWPFEVEALQASSLRGLALDSPLGGVLSQVVGAYLGLHSGRWELHFVSDLFDRCLPGYFGPSTVVTITHQQPGTISLPRLVVLTPVA